MIIWQHPCRLNEHLLLHSEKKKMIRRGMDWNKMLRFTVPMHGEARYSFDYLTSTYDSVHGEVIKVGL